MLVRKTGITLKDLGERDEHGLEPMDNLFSSPEKPTERSAQKQNGLKKNSSAKKQDATLSSSDMDIPDSMSSLEFGRIMYNILGHATDNWCM